MSEPFVPPVPPAPQAPPPGAYRVPVGGYQAPVGGYAAPPPVAPSRAWGAVSLVAALIAVVVAPIVAGVLALQIGLVVSVDDLVSEAGDFVIAALSPVRTETLWAEIMFWLGTVLGVGAVVGGIVAVARRRGRGMGIAAIVIAAIGPGAFFLAVALMYGIGNGIAFDPIV
ncbi:hypothetical protein AB0N64_14290 [Microbacterium sp. NPDC089318]